ncbi:twin-arginine translocation signal domain-containing protein [Verrucomicrobiota bacterium]
MNYWKANMNRRNFLKVSSAAVGMSVLNG